MANKPVKPGVPTVPLSYKFVRVVYNDIPYHVKIDLDLNSKNFLKVTEIRYSPKGEAFEQKLVAYSTDAQNKQSKFYFPGEPVGGGGVAATKLFNEVIKADPVKQAVASELSSLYGTVKPEVQEEWKTSANNSGTNDILDKIKPGPGLFKPDPAQPPLPDITVGEELGDTTIIALPEEFGLTPEQEEKKKKEVIRSLFPNYGNEPRIITYPNDASYSNSQDHVVIEQFTYKAPQEDLLTKGQNQFTSNFADIVTQGLTRNSNLKSFIGMVKLPIPNQLAMSNEVTWGSDRANPVEAAAFFGALPLAQQALGGNIGGLLSGTFSGFGQLLDQLTKGNFGSGTPAGLLLSSFIAQYALGKVGINVDPAQFIARGTGTTINPNLELLFNGPKLRQFSFAFEFAPNGVNDAKAVRRVMRFFKEGMSPNRLQSNTIFIGSPNVFRVSYRGTGGKQITGLNRFKICALTACEVNYTPEGVYQSYDDPEAVSMPVRSTMILRFTELTPIFAQDYRDDLDPSLTDVYAGIDGSLDADPISTPDDIGF